MTTTLALIVDFLREQLGDPSIAFGVGENARFENAPLNRIVWIHKGGSTEPATWNGPKRVRANGRIVQFFPTYDDVMNIEAHITASNRERYEEIRRKILNATKDLFGTASKPGTYDIATEADKAGNAHNGQVKAIHRFTWRTTIARESQHQLGREDNRQLSPSIPVTELVTINSIEFTYRIEPAAPTS